MSRNIKARLNNLSQRRTGDSAIALDAVLAKAAGLSVTLESYQEKTSREYTRYALGSMQEVGPAYTKICLGEADRVGEQLKAGLAAKSISIETRVQGSVACNVHIKKHSDVDLLALDDRFFTYDTEGPKALSGTYQNRYARSAKECIQELRSAAITALRERFPAVTVTPGSKAIGMVGGSLQRKVDVVPSHWHHTSAYQSTGKEWERGVYILDSQNDAMIKNLPFVHIEKISSRDSVCSGALRKAIRLCKNVKADAEAEGTVIALSSYDIVATMWHADLQNLILAGQFDLAILSETNRHLRFLAENHAYARILTVPDDSRKIFDTDEKLKGLNALSAEISDLAIEVAIEQGRGMRPQGWDAIEKVLKESRQLA
ncbi:hypothetical protein [Duganella sp. BuS-21]|uniref:hypothetical protein n=1 Tax=Duganella sp. BuS-21 TaxID=2943848 RepID=UPI0035A6D6F7